MMEMTPPSERQSSKPPGSRDSKGDSSEKQALGTLGLYLKNRVVPPYHTTPDFLAKFHAYFKGVLQLLLNSRPKCSQATSFLPMWQHS